ncbi:hypothetical protein [Pseudomonas syringae]
MIDYSAYIFQTLAEGLNVPTLAEARLLPPPPEDRQSAIAEFVGLQFSPAEYIGHSSRFYEVTLGDERLLALVNVAIEANAADDLTSLGISAVSASDALMLASAKEMTLQRISTASLNSLEENILSQQNDSALYQGHKIAELVEYLEPVVYYRLEVNSPMNGRSSAEVAYHIATYSEALVNPKLKCFIEGYRELLSYPGSFMKQNIFWSLTSTHYKHAFLELYRCIESVYTLPRALALKRKAGLTLAGHAVAKMCVEELDWRRKEEDSLKQIFRLIPISIFQNLSLEFLNHENRLDWRFDDPTVNEKRAAKLAEYIYLLRNQMVHQFDTTKEILIRPSDWPILINLLICVISFTFTHYACELPGADPENVDTTSAGVTAKTELTDHTEAEEMPAE